MLGRFRLYVDNSGAITRTGWEPVPSPEPPGRHHPQVTGDTKIMLDRGASDGPHLHGSALHSAQETEPLFAI
jgi:hypothetical protein